MITEQSAVASTRFFSFFLTSIFTTMGFVIKLRHMDFESAHTSQSWRDRERLDDAGREAQHVDIPVVVTRISRHDARRLIQNQNNIRRSRTGRVAP